MENLDKYIKLMMLTTSIEDGEALNAIRAANKILKTNGLSFNEFVLKVAKKEELEIKEHQSYHYDFEWRMSKKGNYWRKKDDIVVTVFFRNNVWSWVYDGKFSDKKFHCKEYAMENFDEQYGI